ncbi:hypothetical protein TTRE_0000287001 [Trichuris trichiura]|uniref:Uncharacterized protein n=1 Tax=Trichuris trichiura TaxID=36087 RepID=A0A077Z7F0_TRITR|nr:hypothetical protein TTRE_0000287001 [Trichuris trichiura]
MPQPSPVEAAHTWLDQLRSNFFRACLPWRHNAQRDGQSKFPEASCRVGQGSTKQARTWLGKVEELLLRKNSYDQLSGSGRILKGAVCSFLEDCLRFSAGLSESIAIVMEMLSDNQQLDALEAVLFMVACAEKKIISHVENCLGCWNTICICSHAAYGCPRGAQNDITNRMLMMLLENDMIPSKSSKDSGFECYLIRRDDV